MTERAPNQITAFVSAFGRLNRKAVVVYRNWMATPDSSIRIGPVGGNDLLAFSVDGAKSLVDELLSCIREVEQKKREEYEPPEDF